MITNRDSINNLYTLLENNNLESFCLCGYNYEIQFYDKNDKIIFSELYFPGNRYSRNDNEIREAMNNLGEKMYVNPSFYIYNIEVNTSPEIAIEELKSKGFRAIIMNEYEEKDSTIQILYNQDFRLLKRELKKFPFIETVEEAIESLQIGEDS